MARTVRSWHRNRQAFSALQGFEQAQLIDRLNRELARALGTEAAKAWFRNQGATVLSGTPSEFGKRIKADYERWGEVIRAAGIKAQ